MKSMVAPISCIVAAPFSFIFFIAIICSAILQLQFLHVHHLLAWFVLMLLLALSSTCLAHCITVYLFKLHRLPFSAAAICHFSCQVKKRLIYQNYVLMAVLQSLYIGFLMLCWSDTQVYECKMLPIQKKPAALRKTFIPPVFSIKLL